MPSSEIVANAMLESKLRARQINMTFKSGSESISVLENIDLDVATGEFLCLVGPSGCGKSTLLSIMAGFLSPTSGTVTIDQEKITGPDPRRIFVFQERGVFPWLTVEGNVGFGLFKLPKAEQDRRVAHYIKLVGLEGFENAYPP